MRDALPALEKRGYLKVRVVPQNAGSSYLLVSTNTVFQRTLKMQYSSGQKFGMKCKSSSPSWKTYFCAVAGGRKLQFSFNYGRETRTQRVQHLNPQLNIGNRQCIDGETIHVIKIKIIQNTVLGEWMPYNSEVMVFSIHLLASLNNVRLR